MCPQPFYNGDPVFQLPVAQVPVHVVDAIFTELSTGSVVHGYLDQAFLGPPLGLPVELPAITHSAGIGSSVNIDHDRILFGRIKIEWPGDADGKLKKTIFRRYSQDLRFGHGIGIKIRSFAVSQFKDQLALVVQQGQFIRG